MAATVAQAAYDGAKPLAPSFIDRLTVTADDSYPAATGGYPIDLSTELPGKTVVAVIPVMSSDGYLGWWDAQNGKLKFYYFNYDAADGPAIEVVNAADLTDVTLDLVILSK